MPESIVEFVTSRNAKLRVDNGGGVIRGVKVLGTESSNGRSYPRSTLERALVLYADARVNVNHPAGKATDPRRYEDRIGIIRDPVLHEDGIYGDLYYNPKHNLAAQLEWDAEHSPESVGLSHNVAAAVSRKGGRMVVEDISKVLSVDLVADPATTRGLFESFTGDSDMSLKDATVEQLREEAPDQVKAIIAEAIAALDNSTELEQAKATIAALEAEQKTLKAKVEELTEQAGALTAEKATKEKRDAIDAVLAEAKIPADILTEDVRTTAHGYDDIEGVKRYVATLEAAVLSVAGKPKSKEQDDHSDETPIVKDGNSLRTAITF